VGSYSTPHNPFEENESNVEEYKEIFRKDTELLKSVSEEESAMFYNFEYFLSHLEISYEEYKFAFRSSLKKPQVFFRRQFSDRLLNAYKGPDNAKEVTRFIDRFITTSGDDPEMHKVT